MTSLYEITCSKSTNGLKGNNCIVFNLPDRLQVVDNPHLGVIYVFQRIGFRENKS